jgi:RNAse (barnase) inhibitor barstar
MKQITIDGNNFNDLDSFFDEVQRKFCPDFKEFGRNLNAFNDVLYGGFKVFEYEEPIAVIWINSEKSKHDFDKEDPTLFDDLCTMIEKHEHITFTKE